MSILEIARDPGGPLDAEASAIKTPAMSIALPFPVAARVNWLLAARGSVVFQGAWPSAIEDMDSRIYHRPSANCNRIAVMALIERASSASGTISVYPSNGASSTITLDHDLTDATTRWGSPGWVMWFGVASITGSGLQYHSVAWTDLKVRSLTVIELPRDVLDSTSDAMVELVGGGYAGFEGGRMISDATVAGINDLLAGIASARDNTRRHGGGIIMPDASAWALESKGAWANVADGDMGTSGFHWLHRARRIRSATDAVEYDVAVRARYVPGTGTGDFRLRTAVAGDSATITGVTSSWAWHTNTVDVAADQDERLYPEIYTTTDDTDVEVSSVQYLEAA